MTKIELPLERLNEALDGGVEDGSSVLFLADLAVDKAEFAKALCNFRLDEEDNLIYFINNKMPEYIDQRIDKEGREDKVSIIDGFSSTLDKKSGQDYQLETSLKDDTEDFLEESKEKAKQAIEDMEGFGSTFVLDSLDAFVGQWEQVEDLVNEIKPVAERTNTVAYYFLPNLGFEEEGEQETSIDQLEEIFDYVIHLKGLERSGIVLKFIDVRKPEHVDTKVPYDVTAQGLVMYVPKILVTGPYDSGKSTTVQNMSENAVSVDRLGTTVALDHGSVERKGVKAELFGTPGQKRFDWALDFLGKSTFGCFILVDSRDPNYDRVKQMKTELEEEDLPYIVLANFQNKDDAMPPEQIQEELEMETIGVDAKHGENLDTAVEQLMDKILSTHKWYYA